MYHLDINTSVTVVISEVQCTNAAAEEVDLLPAVDPNIKPAAVRHQETCWFRNNVTEQRKQQTAVNGTFSAICVQTASLRHLYPTWNNDVSITKNGELHPTQVLGPGREPRDTHHHR